MIVEPPLSKLMVPVGVAVEGEVAVTVAVKVAAPYVPGLGLDARAVLVPDAVTVWDLFDDVDDDHAPVPPNEAVTLVGLPTGTGADELVVNVATPDELAVALPSVVAPAVKVTVPPLGLPLHPEERLLQVTLAVKVIGVP